MYQVALIVHLCPLTLATKKVSGVNRGPTVVVGVEVGVVLPEVVWDVVWGVAMFWS